jgi:hypothetical protein
MTVFRLFLSMLFATIALYTAAVITTEGLSLLPVFFGDLLSLTWRGQFNLDFAAYLMLSGLWIAWRGGFAGGAIALGVAASLLGMLLFAPYLLYLCARCKGDPRTLLIGEHRNAP